MFGSKKKSKAVEDESMKDKSKFVVVGLYSNGSFLIGLL